MFRMILYEFADLTHPEVTAMYTGLKAYNSVEPVCLALRVQVQWEIFGRIRGWTTQGVVTPEENREQCGSCWSGH